MLTIAHKFRRVTTEQAPDSSYLAHCWKQFESTRCHRNLLVINWDPLTHIAAVVCLTQYTSTKLKKAHLKLRLLLGMPPQTVLIRGFEFLLFVQRFSCLFMSKLAVFFFTMAAAFVQVSRR